MILSDLTFTTGKVEGVSAQGCIDAETLSAMLVGKTVLPPNAYSPYKEWLANQPVLMELKVGMKNPYKK